MRHSYFIFLCLVICFLLPSSAACGQVTPLLNAHAHNDYKHAHPLTDALDNGFGSVEADIFLIRGKLLVSHIRPLFKKRTLPDLYLEPLLRIVNEKGRIYANADQPFILLIDIKTSTDETYAALNDLLEKYSSMLTSCENGVVTNRAVTIIITGNKPYKQLRNQVKRFAFIDESLMDLQKENTAMLCPLASTKYSNIIHQKGKGKISSEERSKLLSFVKAAHEQGKKVRLWASPENKIAWKELLDDGVDYINTDKLKEFRNFYLDEYSKDH